MKNMLALGGSVAILLFVLVGAFVVALKSWGKQPPWLRIVDANAPEPEPEYSPGDGPAGEETKPPDPLDYLTAIEREFRNVFAFSADRGEGLLPPIMKRLNCSRIEAMKVAIEDKRREEKRFD